MKTPTSSKVVLSAAIVMGWIWLTAGDCGEGTPTGPAPPRVQDCPISYDPGFPANSSLSFSKPANCPLRLAGNTPIAYAATVEMPSGSVQYGFYENQVVSWDGFTTSYSLSPVWSQGGGKIFVNISGTYYAAARGFDPTNNRGWDDIRNRFRTFDGVWRAAISRMTYEFGIPNNRVSAPSPVDPYATYTVSATTHDPRLVEPLTWSWYVDGAFYGTTSTHQINVSAGGPSSPQSIEAVATDPTGLSASGSMTVWTWSGCGDVEHQC